jgi:putative ABC transport system substrate-binding protein
MGFIAHGHESFYDALFEGLRELGYEEGRNLIVERRYARGQAERFKEFAAEMVRLNVDVIVVVTTPAALAVKKATTTIPIVHPNAIDPLNTGLIASLAHPGGNLTGGAQLTAEVSAKRLEILKKMVPGLSARGGALESGQPRSRIFLERDARCGARAGTNASIPRGARTEGLCGCLCHDRRRASRRSPRIAGCGDDAAAKRDH